MRIRRGRRCRPAGACLWGAGITLAALGFVLGVPGPARAGEGATTDPRDVGMRLDLKALTHAEAGPFIVYTAETYAPFTDQVAVFKWGIDRDHDEAFDLIVSTEWRGGKLVGTVKDAGGQPVAPATVTRSGATAIQVSFPAEVLKGASSYRYAVDAEPAGGERDLAPNSGLIQHRLGLAGGSRTANAAPAKAPVAAPAKAEPAAPAPDGGTAARTAAEAAPVANLPTTGPDDRALLPWAGGALMAGGALVGLGARRNRARRGEVPGGIR